MKTYNEKYDLYHIYTEIPIIGIENYCFDLIRIIVWLNQWDFLYDYIKALSFKKLYVIRIEFVIRQKLNNGLCIIKKKSYLNFRIELFVWKLKSFCCNKNKIYPMTFFKFCKKKICFGIRYIVPKSKA